MNPAEIRPARTCTDFDRPRPHGRPFCQPTTGPWYGSGHPRPRLHARRLKVLLVHLGSWVSRPRFILSRGSGAGTSGAAAKVAIVCNRETRAPTIAQTIARIVALRTTIGAIVAIVGAIVSRMQTIATFAAAPLAPAPLPRLKFVRLQTATDFITSACPDWSRWPRQH